MEVTLEEMLRAREDRVRRQEAMLRRYGGPLISFSMNSEILPPRDSFM